MPDLYLLHWDPPYHHASHYLGYAKGIGRGRQYADEIARCVRIGAHELVMAVQQAGCVIQVADVWVGESRDRGTAHL